MARKKTNLQHTPKKSKPEDNKNTKNDKSKKIKLQIAYPQEGLASSDDNMDVTVQAILDKGDCNHEEILKQIGGKIDVNIVLDNEIVVAATHKKGKKAHYIAKIKLKYISEGLHKIQAIIPHKGRTKTRKILDSESVSFSVDRTRPFIRSALKYNFVKDKEDGASEIIVDAEDIHSGLDAEKCSLTVNDMTIENPLKLEKGLLFPLKSKLDEGRHKTKLILFDMAGNKLESDSECTIDRTPPVIHSVSPTGILKNEDSNIAEIIVYASDAHSGIDMEKCFLAINDKTFGSPSLIENGLAFQLKMRLDEGAQKIKLILFDMAGNKSEYNSDFTIDRTPPVISSVSPSGIVKIEETNISKISVKVEDSISGLDLDRCIAKIDGKSLEKPSKNNNGITFPFQIKLNEGIHKMIISVFDLANNRAEYETDLIIDKTAPVIRSMFFSNMIKVN